jgi:hypothetical protein
MPRRLFSLLGGATALVTACAATHPRGEAGTSANPAAKVTPTAARIIEQVSADPRYVCPPDSVWVSGCSHPRATCGGWDGISCPTGDADEAERAAALQFARIDEEAHAACPEDDPARQVYRGDIAAVVDAVESAMGGAGRVEQKLEELSTTRPTPRWAVARYARAGVLFECIGTSIRKSNPNPWSPRWGGKYKPTFLSLLLRIITSRTVNRYLTAAALARRFGFAGFAFTHAGEGLSRTATLLGEDAMRRFADETLDPTDPQPFDLMKRRIPYTAELIDP